MAGFGFSPSDILKLIEISTNVYVAFSGAYNNSEKQVEGLVREFSDFHLCLIELQKLMKEYGKPLPLPYLNFEKTLEKCMAMIKPYSDSLVDKKMSAKKAYHTIAWIGKEKDINRLRSQLAGHSLALHMCISFISV
jgi:hypothetical protein